MELDPSSFVGVVGEWEKGWCIMIDVTIAGKGFDLFSVHSGHGSFIEN